MKVRVGTWAWMQKAELPFSALQAMKHALTIYPQRTSSFGTDDEEEDKGPLELFTETETEIGVAREYFLSNRRGEHDITFEVTEGSKATWPGPLEWSKSETLRTEQQTGLLAVTSAFRNGKIGGMVKAAPGWGKTTFACALMAKMQLPTLVVVHKEFLMGQWIERIEKYLPGAKIGIAQQQKCEYEGSHIVVGMVHSLARGGFPKAFYNWPGLMIVDEAHRIGARTWAPVPALFPAKYRLGLSATPRRKDGADNVFHYHLGPSLFQAKEQRLKPTIKRVYTKFRLVKTPNFNPNLASEQLILRFLCANDQRNRRIVELMIDAVKAGRKLLILSKRLNHLSRLEAEFHREWRDGKHGPAVSSGYYVGGMTEDERYRSSLCRIVFATAQFAAEGLDIPPLDTLFLVNPMGDVEQAVGRVLRPYEGKKPPIVVDIRDDMVPLFESYGKNREKLYARIT